jgi:hypothetical protein
LKRFFVACGLRFCARGLRHMDALRQQGCGTHRRGSAARSGVGRSGR